MVIRRSYSGQYRLSAVVSSLPASTPDAISTVNGSPARRAPTLDLDVAQAGVASAFALKLLVVEARASGRRARSRTQASCVLAQIEHQHAPARHDDPRRFAQRRAAGSLRVVQRLRQQRDVDASRRAIGSCLELAALPDDVRHAAPRGQRRARARARPPIDRRRSPATPSGWPRSSGSLRRIRGPRRASGGSSRPRARDHAAQLRPGTSCRASRVRAGVRVEVLLPQPQHFLSRASSARPTGRRPPRSNCACSSTPERRVAVVAARGRPARAR